MQDPARQRARKRLDARLEAIKPVDHFAAPPKGWVRAIRDALGMTGAQLAARLGMSPQGVVALERSEAGGTIQLNTLRRAAEALDGVLVYAIVPRTSLSDMADSRARALAMRALGRVSHSMALEDQQVDRDIEDRIQAYIAALRDRDLWDAG